MKKTLLLLFLILFSCSNQENDLNIEENNTISDKKNNAVINDVDYITIIHDTEYVPYYMSKKNSDGSITRTGLLFDILSRAANKSGIKIKFVQVPGWSRCVNLMKAGKADAMFPIFKTKERTQFMYYFDSAILAYEENVLVSLKSQNKVFDGNLNNLQNSVIGVIPEYSYGEKFDSANSLKKVDSENEKSLLKLLYTGKRYDFIIGNKIVLKYYSEESNNYHKLKFHKPSLSNDPLYLAFSKKSINEEKAKKMAIAIAKFKKTKEYKDLLKANHFN